MRPHGHRCNGAVEPTIEIADATLDTDVLEQSMVGQLRKGVSVGLSLTLQPLQQAVPKEILPRKSERDPWVEEIHLDARGHGT